MYQENVSNPNGLITNDAANTLVEQPDSNDSGNTANDVLIGIVTGCAKLNVRRGPIAGSEIVCEVIHDTELMIDESESTDDFYKVCTAAGIEGFCMRKYVAIQS